MEIITTVDGVRKQVKEWRKEGLSVGLVPTMGYLHEGHKSLIDKAVAENDRVVVSVFVNPIQFGPTEDLASYPRDLDRDAELCEKAGANVIFHPEDSEMYFDDFRHISAEYVRWFPNCSILLHRTAPILDRKMPSN